MWMLHCPLFTSPPSRPSSAASVPRRIRAPSPPSAVPGRAPPRGRRRGRLDSVVHVPPPPGPARSASRWAASLSALGTVQIAQDADYGGREGRMTLGTAPESHDRLVVAERAQRLDDRDRGRVREPLDQLLITERGRRRRRGPVRKPRRPADAGPAAFVEQVELTGRVEPLSGRRVRSRTGHRRSISGDRASPRRPMPCCATTGRGAWQTPDSNLHRRKSLIGYSSIDNIRSVYPGGSRKGATAWRYGCPGWSGTILA